MSNTCQEQSKTTKRRLTQNETLKLLDTVRPQLMMGLSQTFKKMRRDNTRMTAQYLRTRQAGFPLEVRPPQSRMVYRPIYIVPAPVYSIPIGTPSQEARVSIQNLLTSWKSSWRDESCKIRPMKVEPSGFNQAPSAGKTSVTQISTSSHCLSSNCDPVIWGNLTRSSWVDFSVRSQMCS
ncbi:hypothetical protein PROFUN_01896 [Planoprotostelium fungivorum]|uniref:Uncharacterized protein n=1 Tax=Planoprotostelium fungivorum TaxID=1890364 RepID=A0A2P6NYZ4_9EUKA|nr:hypothetical protein PROFUN_01896 [Planoprotostelium fungivorum]